MQPNEHALAIERATQALYATASEPRPQRAVKTILIMMVLAVVLLAMVPVLASSMTGSGNSNPPHPSVSASSSDASYATPAVHTTP
jgi:flagellar basal body-associated protein FliL